MRKPRTKVGTLLVPALLLLSACSPVPAPDDRAITEKIQAKLYQDQTLKGRDISVITQNGTVVLTGQVQSEEEKAAAEMLASEGTGAKKVINELAFGGAPAASVVPPTRESAAKAAAGAAALANEAKKKSPALPPPIMITIPTGTAVSLQMIDGIDSKTSQPGTEFTAALVSPVTSGERVVFAQGSHARVRLVTAKQAGRMQGSSELQVELACLSRGGEVYQVQSSAAVAKGASRGKQTAGGAVIEGVIRGIPGGRKGLAIGAGAGVGGAPPDQAVTKGSKVQIAPETKLDFTLMAPMTVTLPSQTNKSGLTGENVRDHCR